jgi:hypothetical protein
MFRKKDQKPVNRYVVDNFSNSQIEEKLLGMDIYLIEDAIEKEQSQFIKLQDLKRGGELNFGLKSDKIDLQKVYFDLKHGITSLLGVSQGMPDPKFRLNTSFNFPAVGGTLIEGMGLLYMGLYSLANLSGIINFDPIDFVLPSAHALVGDIHRRTMMPLGSMYNQKTKKMTLGNKPEAELIPAFAHELDHHILSELGVPYNVFSGKNKSVILFHEGHAQGVQRIASDQYFGYTGNEAYLYGSSKADLIVLKKTYKWLCKKTGQKPKSEFVTSDVFVGGDRLYYSMIGSSERHMRGSAFFYLLEQEQGKSVYKDTLRDPAKVFSFKDM